MGLQNEKTLQFVKLNMYIIFHYNLCLSLIVELCSQVKQPLTRRVCILKMLL